MSVKLARNYFGFLSFWLKTSDFVLHCHVHLMSACLSSQRPHNVDHKGSVIQPSVGSDLNLRFYRYLLLE